MTVYDICKISSRAAIIEVFCFNIGRAIFYGFCDEIPDEIGEAEIASIDTVFPESQHLTINID